jgi:hypothetical protein
MPKDPAAMHVDSVLTNLSMKYRNDDMIWPLVMPVLKVNKRSDIWYVYNKADSFKLVDDSMGSTDLANEVSWGVATDNYSVKDHGLGDWLAQSVINNSDNPLQPEIDTNDFLNMCLDVAQEKRVVDKVFAAASYPVGNKVQLAGNDRWGLATDDSLNDVETAIEACFQRANTLVFGADVWLVFRKLPEVVDAIKAMAGTTLQGGKVSAEQVAAYFEVERVLVGRARYNTAKPGQAASYSRLWGKHVAALHVNKSPGIKTIMFGATVSQMLRTTARDFDSKRGTEGAHYIRPAWNSDEKIVAADCGYFIEDAIA